MLEKFGLSNYENKVYLALLELGTSDARTISLKSQVPYGRIYDVLDSLNSQKIIIEQNGRPKRYMVVEPSVVVNSLIEAQKRQIDELNRQSDLAIQQLNRLYESKPREKLVWKVAIGDELFDSYFDLIHETRREFLGYVELDENIGNNPTEIESYMSSLSRFAQNSIQIKVLLGVKSEEVLDKFIEAYPQAINMLGTFDIRITSTLTHPFTIIDSEKVILKVVNPSTPSEMLAAVYLWQKDLARTLKIEFNKLWESGKTIKLAISS